MDRFLGMNFRQYAAAVGVLNANNLDVFRDLKRQPINYDDVDAKVREDLLTIQI